MVRIKRLQNTSFLIVDLLQDSTGYTLYREGFLLVNIRLFVYNILSVQAHNICNIFLTAGKQNS